MHPRGAAVLFPILALTLTAQDQAPPPPRPPAGKARRASKIFRAAVESFAELAGFRFTGEIRFPGGGSKGNPRAAFPPVPFFPGAPRPSGRKVEGREWKEGLVVFSLEDGERGALQGGFILYREGKEKWVPRFAAAKDGSPLWWIPDPRRLLVELLAADPKVELLRHDTLDARPMRVLEVRPGKRGVKDLFLSRLLPDPSKVPSSGRNRIVFVMGLPGAVRIPRDLEYRILLWVEPGTNLVHKIQVEASCSGQGLPGGGPIRIRLKGGKPLPVPPKTKKEEKKKVDLVILLEDLGSAPPPPLPRPILERLGIPPFPGSSPSPGGKGN